MSDLKVCIKNNFFRGVKNQTLKKGIFLFDQENIYPGILSGQNRQAKFEHKLI